MSDLVLTIKRQSERSVKFHVSADNGSPLHADVIELTKASERERFAEDVVRIAPGIDREAILKELLQRASEEVTKTEAPAPEPVANDATEIDIKRIIRPELFITPAVTGICVPQAVEEDGKIVGRWMMHLRWSSCIRQTIEIPSTLVLPNTERVFIHPLPEPPSPSIQPAWSAQSRAAWLKITYEYSPDGLVTIGHIPDVASVFKRLCAAIDDYLDFPPEKAAGYTTVLALFVLLTYTYPAWYAVPYLYVGGPIGSGKTRIFELLVLLAFRPLLSSNLTAALLFRTLHQRGGVLLLDEAERLKDSTPDAGELRSILLAGYKRGGKAQRCKPDTFELKEFDVFGPKVIACVAGLPSALASRCIPITMFRCPADSTKPKKILEDEASRWSSLRDDLHLLTLENGPRILELSRRSDVCPSMTGRNYELWQPLLALASWVESAGAPGVLNLVQAHATGLISESQEDNVPENDATFLRILAGFMTGSLACTPSHPGVWPPGPTSSAQPSPCYPVFRPQAKDILQVARDEEPEAFTKFTSKGVGTILRRYGLRPTKSHGVWRYSVSLCDLRRIESTYGFDLNLPPKAGGYV